MPPDDEDDYAKINERAKAMVQYLKKLIVLPPLQMLADEALRRIAEQSIDNNITIQVELPIHDVHRLQMFASDFNNTPNVIPITIENITPITFDVAPSSALFLSYNLASFDGVTHQLIINITKTAAEALLRRVSSADT